MASLQHVGAVSSFLGARCRKNRLAVPVARAHSQSPFLASPLLASNFAEHMLALEAVLPTMSCSQLAETATSVRETYRAALLSTEAAGGSSNSSAVEVQDVGLLLDYFNCQLPNQSWLLTYRAAVERHLLPQEGTKQAHQPGTAESCSSAGSAGGQHASSTAAGPAAAYSCTPEHLAEILSTIATLPIQVVQPLPIGFGTPRWSRPLAAADPTAWEQWLSTLAMVYSELLAQQHLKTLQQQQQQQHTPGSHDVQTHPEPEPQQQQQQQQVVRGCEDVAAAVNCSSGASAQLLQQLADFIICLACSMRWVNVNVDDDRLQTPAFRERVLQSLRLQQQQEQQAAAAGVEQRQQQQSEAVGRADMGQQKHLGAAILQPLEPSSLQQQQLQEPAQQQQQQQQQQNIPAQQMQQVPFALAGSLAHRLTYTCLLLLLPPPRPMLAAFFQATDPQDFSLVQLQGIVRGLLFVGCAPPEPWLKSLVQLVRARAGELGQRDVLGFVEAFRFFGTQSGRLPWLRDVTAMLEEFSCVG